MLSHSFSYTYISYSPFISSSILTMRVVAVVALTSEITVLYKKHQEKRKKADGKNNPITTFGQALQQAATWLSSYAFLFLKACYRSDIIWPERSNWRQLLSALKIAWSSSANQNRLIKKMCHVYKLKSKGDKRPLCRVNPAWETMLSSSITWLDKSVFLMFYLNQWRHLKYSLSL